MQAWKPFNALIGGDMSGNLTGPAQDVRDVSLIGAEFTWTGNPTGTLKIQASSDIPTDNSNGPPANAQWFDVPASVATFPSQPAGTATGCVVPIVNFGWSWLRVVYTRTSGSGTLQAPCTGKRR